MSTLNMWEYSDVTWSSVDLVGFSVEALDGSIGKIDEASNDVGSAYLVVDTGPWIFGKKVIVPAGTATHIDHSARRVYIDRSKDQIRSAPGYGDDVTRLYPDPAFRDKLSSYYLDTYR